MPSEFNQSWYDFLRYHRQNECEFLYTHRTGLQNLMWRRAVPTFGRASTKTFQQGGKLFTAGSGALTPDGRIDPAYTNLDIWSQDADNAAVLKTNLHATTPIIANSAIAPDGTMTMDKMIEDATAGVQHGIRDAGIIAVTSGQAYTVSAYVKADTRTWVFLQLGTGAFSGTPTAFFNLATGAIGTASGGATARIERDATSGGYRVIMTATATATTSSQFRVNMSTGDTVQTYNGDNASGLYVWGRMYESGSIAHPYYPTTTVAAGPLADVLTANVGLTSLGGSQRTYAIMYEQDYPFTSYEASTGFFFHHLKVSPQDSIQLTTNAAKTQIVMNLRDEGSIVTQLLITRATVLAPGRHVIIASLSQSASFLFADGAPHDSTILNGTFSTDGTNNQLYIGAPVASGFQRGVRILYQSVFPRAIHQSEAPRMESTIRQGVQ